MVSQETISQKSDSEVAFYYPNFIWRGNKDWIKNLILFFDGIGLLVPNYMRDRPEAIDPIMIEALKDHDLLHVFEPETLVDKHATEKLAMAMTEIIASGALDSLAVDDNTAFHELSYSRLGFYGDRELAEMINDELKSRGLARDSEDGVSIPMHPMVRNLILVLLAQILRPFGKKIGFNLAPVTDEPRLIKALSEILSIPNTPSAGQVVSLDIETVGIDLSSIPIDEVLGFRKDHYALHRSYAREVRRFVRYLSVMPIEDREKELIDRREELRERTDNIRRLSQKAWGTHPTASFGLGIAGASWAVVTGDVIGGVISGLGIAETIRGLLLNKDNTVDAYSYIFKARRLG